MSELQRLVIDTVKSVANRFGNVAEVSSSKYSEDFRCEYFAVSLPWAGITGAVFPADANFWNDSGLDERFERIDFESDAAMCSAIADSLITALQHC